MGIYLYENGKRIGEIEDWSLGEAPAEYKDVLGKKVLSTKSTGLCTFTSPKPVRRKGSYSVVVENKTEFILKLKEIKNRTIVTAIVTAEHPLK